MSKASEILRAAIAAAEADPHGGKVYLSLDDAHAALAERAGGEPAAFLVERLAGSGYGAPRTIIDAAKYDPRREDFWFGDAKSRHLVTPLYALITEPPAPEGRQEIICDVLTMKHSSGFPDHFTRIRKGDRALTMFSSKIKGRCEYHAAELDWLLNGNEKPHILDFSDEQPEGLSEYLAAITSPAEQAVTDERGPVPTHECEFRVGQAVRVVDPASCDDPSEIFYVSGISWEHRMVASRGWNITIATQEEIEKGYGQTDGYTPSDLRPALAQKEEGR